MQAERQQANLPLVRRLEAVSFRAWPAASVQYDGSWQVRLTGGHPSKRLNCVVALDPSDSRDIAIRLERAARKFDAYGRPLVVRETPLTPKPLVDHLIAEGWTCFEEVVTQTADLTALEIPDTLDHLPTQDVGRFVDASLALRGQDPALKPVLAEVINSIKPTVGMFLIEDPNAGPVASLLCVQDNDLAGILLFAVSDRHRRRGVGMEVLSSALRWARMRGARTAWLQVSADNEAALSLYAKLGFVEAYRYYYWSKDGSQ